MLLFDFHDFDGDAFFFDESDRQVFVAYGRAEDHLLAFQLFLQRRNGVGNVSLFLYQFGQTAAFLEFQEFDAIRTFAIVCQPYFQAFVLFFIRYQFSQPQNIDVSHSKHRCFVFKTYMFHTFIFHLLYERTAKITTTPKAI